MKTTAADLVCVVLPVYKEVLHPFDAVSLRQCFTILRQHPITLVCADDLNVGAYQQIADAAQKEIHIIRKDPAFFAGIEGYNKLMLSEQFYAAFAVYRYILIYQTDCFVFKDELQYWCNKGYDYIGAPWINTDLYAWLLMDGLYPRKLRLAHRLFKNAFISKVGNGGFSLRNVSACLSMLRRYANAAKSWKAYEDSFFSHYAGTFDPFFNIAGVHTALQFGFDIFPQQAFERNHKNLPFGCHGWYRTDPPHYAGNLAFWKNYIHYA